MLFSSATGAQYGYRDHWTEDAEMVRTSRSAPCYTLWGILLGLVPEELSPEERLE